jgi:hypothetical protein
VWHSSLCSPDFRAADGVEQDGRGLGKDDMAMVGDRELDTAKNNANKE